MARGVVAFSYSLSLSRVETCLSSHVQVLGITNYSHWGDAGQMRECMWESPVAQSHLLRVASERIKKFFHIGVTDRLYDSVAAAGVRRARRGWRLLPCGGAPAARELLLVRPGVADSPYDSFAAAGLRRRAGCGCYPVGPVGAARAVTGLTRRRRQPV